MVRQLSHRESLSPLRHVANYLVGNSDFSGTVLSVNNSHEFPSDGILCSAWLTLPRKTVAPLPPTKGEVRGTHPGEFTQAICQMSRDAREIVPFGEKVPIETNSTFLESVDIESPRIWDSKVKHEIRNRSVFDIGTPLVFVDTRDSKGLNRVMMHRGSLLKKKRVVLYARGNTG